MGGVLCEEREGFEPSDPEKESTVFETVSIDQLRHLSVGVTKFIKKNQKTEGLSKKGSNFYIASLICKMKTILN